MGQRSDLSALLNAITPNVYFQPPSNVEMVYPCIIYQRSGADTKFAGDLPYLFTNKYTLTVVDESPDSTLVDAVAALPMCTKSSFFVAENLNHDVFDIYF